MQICSGVNCPSCRSIVSLNYYLSDFVQIIKVAFCNLLSITISDVECAGQFIAWKILWFLLAHGQIS